MAVYKIYKDGEEINRIVASEPFVTNYCEANGYTCELEPEPEPIEPEPTIEERMTALEESNVEMSEALEMILTGVTE